MHLLIWFWTTGLHDPALVQALPSSSADDQELFDYLAPLAVGENAALKIHHHVMKLALAPERRLDRTNLMSLCEPHHDARTTQGE